MENRGRVPLLVTLFAALAVLYPVVGARSPERPPAETKALRGTSETPAGKSANPEFPSAKDLIARFLFGRADERATEIPASTAYRVEFLIATVPDPIDSRLPNLFDSFVESIGSAAEAAGYTLDRFALPWMEEIDSGEKRPPLWRPTLHDSVPGLVLFRKRDAPELLLVLLVGETPTTGIHKQAMFSALDQVAQFYPWGLGYGELKKEFPQLEVESSVEPSCGQARQNGASQSIQFQAESSSETLRLMGPAFSGSAVSLRMVLDSWLTFYSDHPARIQMISGSATVVNAALLYNIRHHQTSFQATVPPDLETLRQAECYIRGLGSPRIAILTERNTEYGQKVANDIAASGKGSNQAQSLCPGTSKDPKIEILDLPFPLHISNLRNAAIQRARAQQQTGSGSESTSPVSAPLATEDTGEPREVVPPFSDLTVRSAELTLSNLFSTIARERYRYVGIVATDVRDAMFLAREVRRHCPATVLFTFNANLLYAASEVNRFTQGMLVFTPYPLFNLEQLWTYPYGGLESRHQFSVQAAEGVYNATLALLHHEDKMVDYGSPLGKRVDPARPVMHKPALWVTAIGNGETLPVDLLKLDDPGDYTYSPDSVAAKCDSAAPPAGPPIIDRGLYSENAVVVVIVLSLLLSAFSVLILSQYPGWGTSAGPNRISALLGDAASPSYWSVGRLYLFSCSASLLTYYMLVAASFCLPLFASWESGISIKTTLTSTATVAIVLMVPTLFLLVSATGALWKAFRRVPADQRRGWKFEVTGFALLGWVLVYFLVERLADAWYKSATRVPANGLFTYLRSFDLRGGLSPLVPLACVAAAAGLWALCSFRRVRLIDILLAPETVGNTEPWLSFLSLEGCSFSGIRELEDNIKEQLESSSAFSSKGYALLMVVALLPGIYFFETRMIHALEPRAFYWIFAAAFFIVYWALLMEFLRLVLTWRSLHQLLQRFSWHPLRAAFKRYHSRFPGLTHVNLTHAPSSFSALESSVEQADQLLRTTRALVDAADTPPELREVLRESIPEWEVQVRAAEDDLCMALRLQWIDSARVGANSGRKTSGQKQSHALIRDWRQSLVASCRAHGALFEFMRSLALTMEPHWLSHQAEGAAPSAVEFFEQAEEFIVSRVVNFLAVVFPSLRNLGYFVLVGLLLMLLAVTSYPFQPRNEFLFFNWVVILSFIGTIFWIFVQMDRDTVLSLLNGGKPGQLNISSELVLRALLYIGAPLLALLGAQFPDTFGKILSVLTAAQGGG